MAKAYQKPILVVEEGLFQALDEIPNPAVFWGALANVTLKWNISVIFLKWKAYSLVSLQPSEEDAWRKKEQ